MEYFLGGILVWCGAKRFVQNLNVDLSWDSFVQELIGMTCFGLAAYLLLNRNG